METLSVFCVVDLQHFFLTNALEKNSCIFCMFFEIIGSEVCIV